MKQNFTNKTLKDEKTILVEGGKDITEKKM